MEVQVGMVINEKLIESFKQQVEIDGYQEFQHTEYSAKHFSADGDENGDFWEAMQFATRDHYHIWERDREYKDVTSKIEDCIRHRLKEGGLIDRWKQEDVDPLTCNYYELFTPAVVDMSNLSAVRRCMWDAAYDVAWMKSESLQLFFQTTNPCCWDGKPPRERYGKDWIKDTETRLYLMVHAGRLNHEVHERLTRPYFKSVLRNTLKDPYEVLCNRNKDINYYIT